MATASGATVSLSYVAEVTRGTTPNTPTMKTLRSIGRRINTTKAGLQSQERRSDRQVASFRHGFAQVQASIPFQLGTTDFDDMIEAAMAGTWTTGVTTGALTTLSAVASGSTYHRSSGSFVSLGIEVGDEISVSGFATSGNNGRSKVLAVTASDITVSRTLTNESAGPSVTIAVVGNKVKIGSTLTTFTFERRFTDISQYQVFTGCAINQLGVQLAPGQLVVATMDIIGMAGGTLSGSSLGAPTAAGTSDPYDSFTGSLYEAANATTPLATVTALNFTLNNSRQLGPVLFSKTSPDVYEGVAQVQGSMTAHFTSAALLNKFLNETESALDVRFDDTNGTDFQRIRFPRIKYSGGEIDPPQDGPVTLNLPFVALVDSTAATTVTWQKSN